MRRLVCVFVCSVVPQVYSIVSYELCLTVESGTLVHCVHRLSTTVLTELSCTGTVPVAIPGGAGAGAGASTSARNYQE